jgi:DNA-binding transcriptional regulator YhcF (GntR family)
MKNIPRIGAQIGMNKQRGRHAVQNKTDIELHNRRNIFYLWMIADLAIISKNGLIINGQFLKVDRYGFSSLWYPIAGTPARPLARVFDPNAALAPAGGRPAPADSRWSPDAGDAPPGERELAAALNVSRTTIASALGQLREEGYLYSRQGSGSRIALPERADTATKETLHPSSVNLATAALSAGPEIHQAYQQALTMLPQHLSNTGYDQHGLPVCGRR